MAQQRTPKWRRQQWRLAEASNDIDLGEDEEILYLAVRHWVVLLARLAAPLITGGLFGVIAAYRSLGGGFLVIDPGQSGELDLVNLLLVAGLALVVFLWFLWGRARKQRRSSQLVLALVGLVITALFWFRYQGGRLFSIDRYAGTPFDLANIFFLGIAAGCLLWSAYICVDWANDQLILTNQRVIDDDEVLLIRHVQQQLLIDDIQNVSSSTGTYPQHWLNYGTITIQSATAGRRIVFNAAQDPREMQRRIDNELKKRRGQQSADQFRSMIEDKVYGTPPPKPPLQFGGYITRAPFFLRPLLHENPQQDARGTVTWRPHWLFVLLSLFQPTFTLLLLLALALLGARTELLAGGWLTLLVALAVLIFVGWAAWEIEDHRNDLYILTPTTVIDVEKKPFGPEDRRTASLGAIQNVDFKTTTVSQVLGYGDVVLTTAGSGGAFTFKHVPRAPEVAATVNEYLNAFKQGEKERNLNDTLTLLKHYHDAQRRHREIK
jgi:hypothetical protein